MRMAAGLLAAALIAAPAGGGWSATAAAQAGPSAAEARAVQAAVEHFLDVLGSRRLDQLPALLAPKATMAVIRQRDGQWTNNLQTADEWLGGLRSQANPPVFREPLTNVSVHVEDGRLAFLRADFTIVIDGQVRSHGVDYFTLVKDGEAWKILSGAYTSYPGAPKSSR